MAVNTLVNAIRNLIKLLEILKPIEPDKLDDTNISKLPRTGDFSKELNLWIFHGSLYNHHMCVQKKKKIRCFNRKRLSLTG